MSEWSSSQMKTHKEDAKVAVRFKIRLKNKVQYHSLWLQDKRTSLKAVGGFLPHKFANYDLKWADCGIFKYTRGFSCYGYNHLKNYLLLHQQTFHMRPLLAHTQQVLLLPALSFLLFPQILNVSTEVSNSYL